MGEREVRGLVQTIAVASAPGGVIVSWNQQGVNTMKLPRNLGPSARLGYVLVGLGCVGLAVLAPSLRGFWAVIVGLAGVVIAAEGAAGF